MYKSLGLTGNIAKKDLPELVKKIGGWCARNHIQAFVEHSLFPLLKLGRQTHFKITQGDFKECDFLCALGGDGFFLHAVRNLYPIQIPILPINLGSLGFTAQALPKEITSVLNLIQKNKIQITERYLLNVENDGSSFINAPKVALNDVLIIKDTRSRLIHVEVSVNGQSIGEVPCDGLVISSATGSTAYNLSAGGPIVHPTLRSMIITPLLPHTISARPVVLPSNMNIEIKQVCRKDREDALFCVDGQYWWNAQAGKYVRVSLAEKPIRIFEPYPARYFEKFRRNLRWGLSPRATDGAL